MQIFLSFHLANLSFFVIKKQENKTELKVKRLKVRVEEMKQRFQFVSENDNDEEKKSF